MVPSNSKTLKMANDQYLTELIMRPDYLCTVTDPPLISDFFRKKVMDTVLARCKRGILGGADSIPRRAKISDLYHFGPQISAYFDVIEGSEVK